MSWQIVDSQGNKSSTTDEGSLTLTIPSSVHKSRIISLGPSINDDITEATSRLPELLSSDTLDTLETNESSTGSKFKSNLYDMEDCLKSDEKLNDKCSGTLSQLNNSLTSIDKIIHDSDPSGNVIDESKNNSKNIVKSELIGNNNVVGTNLKRDSPLIVPSTSSYSRESDMSSIRSSEDQFPILIDHLLVDSNSNSTNSHQLGQTWSPVNPLAPIITAAALGQTLIDYAIPVTRTKSMTSGSFENRQGIFHIADESLASISNNQGVSSTFIDHDHEAYKNTDELFSFSRNLMNISDSIDERIFISTTYNCENQNLNLVDIREPIPLTSSNINFELNTQNQQQATLMNQTNAEYFIQNQGLSNNLALLAGDTQMQGQPMTINNQQLIRNPYHRDISLDSGHSMQLASNLDQTFLQTQQYQYQLMSKLIDHDTKLAATSNIQNAKNKLISPYFSQIVGNSSSVANNNMSRQTLVSNRRNKLPIFSGNALLDGSNIVKRTTHKVTQPVGFENSNETNLESTFGKPDGSERFSRKVFVGGLPPDIDEEEIRTSFKRFGPLVVDWPHKAESKSYFPPKGYAFLLFHDESSVQALIDTCIKQDDKLYLCVSSPTTKDKLVQIRPWRLSDADYVMDCTLALDPRKTVFVGGVPRPLKASELATIMNNLYGGVCYAGVDTDPDLRYPKGAGRVAFSNHQSYIAAISARFIRINHSDCEKRIEVKPYVLDDQYCDECQGSRCDLKFAPFFCANIACLRYYCENCWSLVHAQAGREYHKPMVKEGSDRPRCINRNWT